MFQLFFYDESITSGQTASRGIGTDMATLDSAYFLSQALLSACMGALVSLTGSVISYIVAAGFAGVIACVCLRRVVFTKQQMIQRIRSDRLQPANYVDI